MHSKPPTAPPALPVPTEHFSHPRLFALTSALIGIQICWAVQVGYITKSFLTMGMPQRFVSYAWLAGPIAGIVVQPIVGVLSDRCTSRYGRRRPFLAAGTCLTAFCLVMFSFAGPIGRALGDPPPTAELIVFSPRGIAIGLASFWALDFSINAAQGPLRALLTDVVPPAQHSTANSYFALATGLGNCIGSLFGAVRLTKYLPFFPGDLQALFCLAALVLSITVAVTLFFIKETPLPVLQARARQITPVSETDDLSPRRPLVYETMSSQNDETSEQQSATKQPVIGGANQPGDRDGGGDGGGDGDGDGDFDRDVAPPPQAECVSFFQAARIAPDPFWQAFTVQCFSWFGWFSLFVFATSWVGAEVLNGSFTSAPGTPLRERYDHGVRMGNLGIGLQSVLTVACAPLLPMAIRRSSPQAVYFAASLVLALCLLSALAINQPSQVWVATGMITLTGFPWTVTMTVPWSLMSEAVARSAPERSGIYATMFNLSQCFPEVLVSLVAERVVDLTGKQASVLGLGGVSVLIAAACIIVLRVGRPKTAVHQGESLSDTNIAAEVGGGHSRV